MNESELNNIHMNESEVVHSVINSRESDVDDSLINDRFKTSEGFHVFPSPYIGNYMPPRPDLSFAGLDEFVFQSAVRKTTTTVPETETSISKTSKDIIEKPKTVRPSAHIIEEWDTDSDNDSVFRPKYDQTKQLQQSQVKCQLMLLSKALQKSAAKTNNFNEKVNTARVNNVTTAEPKAVVSAAEGNEENAAKFLAC
ncbi:hypothetical protein Tco_0067899 [Tanacetum coccineum]